MTDRLTVIIELLESTFDTTMPPDKADNIVWLCTEGLKLIKKEL